MEMSRSLRLFARASVAGVLLIGAGISVADPLTGAGNLGGSLHQDLPSGSLFSTVHPGAAKSLSRSANQGDEAIASSIAVASSEFAAAVQRWAHIKAAEVPWNQNQSLSPISYQPVFLWATGSAGGYAGSATNCQFPTASGTAVPGVSGPLQLSGQTLTINTSTSKQAQAIKTALTNAGALKSGGGLQLLPANFGSTWDGVFCASVKFNVPSANNVQIATWFVPAKMTSAATDRAAATNAALVAEVGRKMAARSAATQPQVGVVLQSGASAIVPH
jgi:hypothetical protein